jgi:phenylpyruvate tautomerase PptA (4-oxalocrotonate tautomerase family)
MSFRDRGGHEAWMRTGRAVKSEESERSYVMPVVFIEAPPGLRPEARKNLVKKITSAIEEVYPIGETLIFLREYPLENVAVNGELSSENARVVDAVRKTMSG